MRRAWLLLLIFLAQACAPPSPAANEGEKAAETYTVELRQPEQGVFAGQDTDFGLILKHSSKGIGDARVEASIDMPEMPGMPLEKPSIHSESVPGEYGVDATFPHGGEFRLNVKFTLPNDEVVEKSFPINVKDRPVDGVPVAKPFEIDLIKDPDNAKPGDLVTLRIAIRETGSHELVKAFDESHTKRFHLVIIRNDLQYFVHLHPVQQPDGTWSQGWTPPAGGQYWVYADVAPKGKGSQILRTSLEVSGPTGQLAAKPVAPTFAPVTVDGLKVSLMVTGTVQVGTNVLLEFKVQDATSGKAVNDLETYLGAAGHLMIVHVDGQTFVHSHPADDVARDGRVKFNARFPRAGVYKAWAQFQRGGKVVTLPFVLEAE